MAQFGEVFLAHTLASLVATGTVAVWKHVVAKEPALGWRRATVYFCAVFLVLVASDLTPMPVGETVRVALFGPSSEHERLTRDAWSAFDRRDFLAAAAAAERVTDEYGKAAEREETRLHDSNDPMPPTGKVWPYKVGKVFSRGLLNDVAASHWIAGQSFEAVGQACKAKAAYAAASRLTYARVWDPQWWPLRGWSPFGWFWSPAEMAQDRSETVTCLQTNR